MLKNESRREVGQEEHLWDVETDQVNFHERERWSYVQHKDFQLLLLQTEKKTSRHRPPVPTTEAERLSYYQGYATSPFKIQITYLQQVNYSRFLWIYVSNVLLKSLPINYMHVFLACYNPREHLFGSKMVPLCIGVSWQVMLCALMQLVCSADILSMLLHYSIFGFLVHSPWNRCTKDLNTLPPNIHKYKCLPIIGDFMNFTKHKEDEISFQNNFYERVINGTTVYFTGAPLSYFMQQTVKTSVLQYKAYEYIVYYAAIWISAGLFHLQIYKRYVWKTLSNSQLIMNLIFLLSALYIIWDYLENDVSNVEQISSHFEDAAADMDLDILAESITGPPIVHFLTSRSTNIVNPGRDSILITSSNALMYLFKGLVYYRLKSYVESIVKVPIMISVYNPFPLFYFWPFFFHNMFFGTFVLRFFFMLNFIIEFIIFMITYQILIEVIISEWRWARHWWVPTILLSSFGLALDIVFLNETKQVLYVLCAAVASLTEVVVVCWFYPLERLFDDMYFQFGAPAQTARKWSLRLVPWYYIYKVYWLYIALRRASKRNKKPKRINSDMSCLQWAWYVPILPLLLGALYSFYRYILLQRQSVKVLFKPRPDWGPLDPATRTIRKQFDSRKFIGSQAPRYLSWRILTKSETKTYRLDVCYDDWNELRRMTGDDEEEFSKKFYNFNP